MPAYRRKIVCASREPPAPRKRQPRKSRKDMTEEEKEAEDDARLFRAANKLNKEAWVATLVPWAGRQDLRWPENTIGIYKSDAKSQFGLTEQEMLTLPHESITMSRKTFYRLIDVKNLAVRKFNAGVNRDGKGKNEMEHPLTDRLIRTFTKRDHCIARRIRKNWSDNDFSALSWMLQRADSAASGSRS